MGLLDGTKEHRMYTSSVLFILILRISTPSTPWQALFLIWKVDSLPASWEHWLAGTEVRGE
jgi:hypothetical protein